MGKAFAWKGNPHDLDGTDDADELHGGNGPNTFRGLGGDDYLSSGNGDDVLEGGDGNDTLVGGDGSDTMSGGAGSDVFVYTDHWQSQDIASDRDGQHDQDAVTDFNPAEDALDFSAIHASGGAALTFADVTAEQDGADTVAHLDLGGLDTNDMAVRLLGITAGDLTEANFVFA